MTETKLLTEAQWCKLLAPYGATEILPYLGEHGLIAEPFDPLLVEAREICAQVSERDGWNIAAEEYRKARRDETVGIQLALAGLRRGKKLAEPKPLTLDMVREAHRASIDMDGDSFHDRFHAALVEQMK
jgi:hypothetical protein